MASILLAAINPMAIAHSTLNHPLRVPLAAEVHSRPSLRLNAPETLTHLALFSEQALDQQGTDCALQHKTLAALCQHFGVAAPGPDAKYFFHDFGRFRLQWECHTEFATYTFAEEQAKNQAQNWPLGEAFEQLPLRHVPEQWLQGLQGQVMVAAHLVLSSANRFNATPLTDLRGFFGGNVLVGSQALQGAEVWTDFALHADGFCRFLVQDVCLTYQQAGRLVQRVLEIETYRMMAMLGLPHAQRATPVLNRIEGELAKLTAAMTADAKADGAEGADFATNNADTADTAQTLLNQILDLAARLEKLALENSYRFAASAAYFNLVQARIEALRESRIEGAPTIVEFMDRRMAPAMSTCAATARRQHALSERIAHTNALLRTKVGIVQEGQNRKILESLNTRAALQLRLQQSVEGLSVVAISYYSIGLISYAAKAVKSWGWPVNPDVLTGVLIPVVACTVWLGLRRMHKRVGKRHSTHA